MATLTTEDAQVLRALVERMSAVEARLNDVEGATAASERAIATTNASANALVSALRLEFDRLQAQVASLADQLTELQTAVEALQAGRGGPAGNAPLDPRSLKQPGKLDGAQAHRKDWLVALCLRSIFQSTKPYEASFL